jgi:hypothetical protein
MVKKKSCECRPFFGLVALILMTLGIYSLVSGFFIQGMGSLGFFNWPALAYYIVGLFLLGLGKMSKFKAHEMCSAH